MYNAVIHQWKKALDSVWYHEHNLLRHLRSALASVVIHFSLRHVSLLQSVHHKILSVYDQILHISGVYILLS
jgi:hypothetical protein